MVNTPNRNFSPLSVAKYGRSTQHSTQQHQQVYRGMNSFDAESVWALGELHLLQSKKVVCGEEISRNAHLIQRRSRKFILELCCNRGRWGTKAT
jgi:hypothetical protein